MSAVAHSNDTMSHSAESDRPLKRSRKPPSLRVLLEERRQFPRLPLKLNLKVKRVSGKPQAEPATLETSNISCSGVNFISDRRLDPGTTIDLEVLLADKPLGGPSMRMLTSAHVVRLAPADLPGWHGVAAVFDDISFDRDPAPAP